MNAGTRKFNFLVVIKHNKREQDYKTNNLHACGPPPWFTWSHHTHYYHVQYIFLVGDNDNFLWCKFSATMFLKASFWLADRNLAKPFTWQRQPAYRPFLNSPLVSKHKEMRLWLRGQFHISLCILSTQGQVGMQKRSINPGNRIDRVSGVDVYQCIFQSMVYKKLASPQWIREPSLLCEWYIWNNHIINAEMKSNEEWSSQLWMKFMQAWKSPELFSRFLCNCINCVNNCEDHSSFDFIIMLTGTKWHIYFISFISGLDPTGTKI